MKYEYEDEYQVKGLSLSVWKRLLPYMWEMRKPFALALSILILWTALNSAFPLFTRYAVNNFIIPETTDGIQPFAALYVGIILIVGFLTYLWTKTLISVEMRIGLMIRRDCFIHLQKLQLAYHNTNSVGYLIGRVMSDTERISADFCPIYQGNLICLLLLILCIAGATSLE